MVNHFVLNLGLNAGWTTGQHDMRRSQCAVIQTTLIMDRCQADGDYYFISDFMPILNVDMQLCTEPQKERETFPVFPTLVGVVHNAFSVMKHTGP